MIRRILAMARKETIHILRDFRTLYLALGMPVVMILLFGYAVNYDIDHIPVGIQDLDNSPESREFIQKLSAGDWFQIERFEKDPKILNHALARDEIKIAVYIPPGYGMKLRRGEISPLGAAVDGSDNNTATVTSNYLELFMNRYTMDRMKEYAARNGIAMPGGIRPEPRIFFNPELKSRYFILPGIIVLTMAMLSAILTSLTIAREWERGTMEQLISTPVRSHEIILGKLIPYTGISAIQVTLAAGFAVFVFHLPFRGGIIALYGTSLLFGAGALGLGMLFSSVLKSQLPAMQAALLVSMLPSLLLSNFVFPIESMPAVVRLITYIVPARYYLVMLRSIFLKGSGVLAYGTEILFLTGFSILVLTIATKRLVKRVA